MKNSYNDAGNNSNNNHKDESMVDNDSRNYNNIGDKNGG